MSDLPVTVDLTKYHGDSWTQSFRFLDGTTPHDLTDAVVSASARSDGVTTQLDVTLGDPGEITVQPPVEGLDIGQYNYDIQITEDGAVLTWVRGCLTIRRDISNG